MAEQWAQDAWAKVQEDQLRTDFLEFLYFQDGRGSKDHPLHSLYTGLYEQWLSYERSTGDTAVLGSDVLADMPTGAVSV
jgi:hypothetical protein